MLIMLSYELTLRLGKGYSRPNLKDNEKVLFVLSDLSDSV